MKNCILISNRVSIHIHGPGKIRFDNCRGKTIRERYLTSTDFGIFKLYFRINVDAKNEIYLSSSLHTLEQCIQQNEVPLLCISHCFRYPEFYENSLYSMKRLKRLGFGEIQETNEAKPANACLQLISRLCNTCSVVLLSDGLIKLYGM